MKFKTFAIDFDDTITIKTKFPEIGELNPHADRVIRRIKENGGEVAIWTCRTGHHEIAVKNFLALHNIPYDSFNEILPSERAVWGEGGRKIFAHCYIDDKGIYAQMNGGIDWLQLEEYIFGEKCNFCDGLGYILNAWAGDRDRCTFCEGKGEV